MILKIVGYGHPSLRAKTEEVTEEYPELSTLIENMFETMYNASGVGLAAPQVGLSIRLFVVDGSPMESMVEDESEKAFLKSFKRVFINPRKVEEEGKKWGFEEGCLSIPDIREEVYRPDLLTLQYVDEQFEPKTEEFSGIAARIVQHEYDHLEGVLFTDYISPLRRRMIKGRMTKISKGEVDVPYPMKFSSKKR